MKLERREWITIGIGSALAIMVILWKLAGSWSESSAGVVIEDKSAQLGGFIALHQQVTSTSRQMGVELPQVGGSHQEFLIRRELTKLAGQGGLQISSTRLNAGRNRGGAEAQPMPFRLELAGQFGSVIAFISDLEHSKIPFVIRDVQIESVASGGGGGQPGGGGSPGMGGSGGRGGGGGGQKQPDGSVRVTMNIDSYIFPKVHVSAKAVKEVEASMPTPAPAQTQPQLIVQQASSSGSSMPPQGAPRMSGPTTSGSRSRSMPPGMTPEKMEKLRARQQEIMRIMREDPARGKQMMEELQKEVGAGK
ncbi:hypothetical protein LLG95_10370 [bacterium]|nr:hypothetical protein [bacterium]